MAKRPGGASRVWGAAALLCCALDAQASPSGVGNLSVGGSYVVQHQNAHATMDAAKEYEVTYSGKGSYGLGLDVDLAMRDWAELSFGAGMGASKWSYVEQINPGVGTLKRDYDSPSQSLSAGILIHLQSLLQGGWRPLPWRSPDGPLYWPRVSASVTRHSSTTQSSIAEESGWFWGNPTFRWTGESLDANYSLHVPLAKRLSLGLGYGHRQYYYETGKDYVYSERDTWDWYNAELFGFFGSPDKAWAEIPGAYHPYLGWPGQWKLSAYYGFNRRADDPDAGSSWLGLSGRMPFNDLLSLSGGVQADTARKLELERWTGFTADSAQRTSLSFWLRLNMNLGSPTVWGVEKDDQDPGMTRE